MGLMGRKSPGISGSAASEIVGGLKHSFGVSVSGRPGYHELSVSFLKGGASLFRPASIISSVGFSRTSPIRNFAGIQAS